MKVRFIQENPVCPKVTKHGQMRLKDVTVLAGNTYELLYQCEYCDQTIRKTVIPSEA